MNKYAWLIIIFFLIVSIKAETEMGSPLGEKCLWGKDGVVQDELIQTAKDKKDPDIEAFIQNSIKKDGPQIFKDETFRTELKTKLKALESGNIIPLPEISEITYTEVAVKDVAVGSPEEQVKKSGVDPKKWMN